VSLNNVGNILRARSDWADALERYEESLEIRRRLLAEEETAGRLRAVSVSLNNVGNILEARSEWAGALERYEESLEIRRRLLAEEETADRLRDVSVSLDNVGNILRARGDWAGALERYEESLGIARRLLEEFGEPIPQWISDFQWSLNRVRDVAIEAEAFDRAYDRAVELWNLAQEEYGDDESPRAREYLLSVVNPVFRCELELGRLEDARESARLVEGFVGSLAAAFEDDTVDRAEQGLDSTTLFRCATGIELVARLRDHEGNRAAQTAAAEFESELRASAEQLKSEEDAATDEESSQ
jgi:tetratricopeptide (TPR) repeat protein